MVTQPPGLLAGVNVPNVLVFLTADLYSLQNFQDICFAHKHIYHSQQCLLQLFLILILFFKLCVTNENPWAAFRFIQDDVVEVLRYADVIQ